MSSFCVYDEVSISLSSLFLSLLVPFFIILPFLYCSLFSITTAIAIAFVIAFAIAPFSLLLSFVYCYRYCCFFSIAPLPHAIASFSNTLSPFCFLNTVNWFNLSIFSPLSAYLCAFLSLLYYNGIFIIEITIWICVCVCCESLKVII